MKALQVTSNYPTPNYPIFGIFMKEQTDSLTALGVDNTVFYSNGKEHGGMKQHVKSVFRLMKHLLTHRYDLIHCHHAVSGLILLLSGGAFFHKSVLSYQNDPSREYGKWVFRLLYPFFNVVIIKNNPSDFLKYKKCVYLPNGCNEEMFCPMPRTQACKTLGWDESRRYVLYMDSNKGKRTQKRKDRYDAVLSLLRTKYGYDNIESVELSNTPRELIPAIMNAVDVHLMTSDFEGSPNSVKECMSCGTPVVSTPVGNVPEMMEGIDGCYVTSGFEEEELAACCDKVFKTPRDGARIREQFLAKGYGLNKVAHKLHNIYRRLAPTN